jgi:hypothetical protein
VQSFISPEELVAIGKEAGFQRIEVQPLSAGISTLYLMHKN